MKTKNALIIIVVVVLLLIVISLGIYFGLRSNSLINKLTTTQQHINKPNLNNSGKDTFDNTINEPSQDKIIVYEVNNFDMYYDSEEYKINYITKQIAPSSNYKSFKKTLLSTNGNDYPYIEYNNISNEIYLFMNKNTKVNEFTGRVIAIIVDKVKDCNYYIMNLNFENVSEYVIRYFAYFNGRYSNSYYIAQYFNSGEETKRAYYYIINKLDLDNDYFYSPGGIPNRFLLYTLYY